MAEAATAGMGAKAQIGRQVGWLHDDQEVDLARAVVAAFDLEVG